MNGRGQSRVASHAASKEEQRPDPRPDNFPIYVRELTRVIGLLGSQLVIIVLIFGQRSAHTAPAASPITVIGLAAGAVWADGWPNIRSDFFIEPTL